MDISVLDFTLITIITFCGGILCTFGFVFCCETKRLKCIANRSYIDNAMNHQRTIYPPEAPVITATAPPAEKVLNIRY